MCVVMMMGCKVFVFGVMWVMMWVMMCEDVFDCVLCVLVFVKLFLSLYDVCDKMLVFV